MSTYDPTAGFTGTPDPTRLAWGQAAIADARRAANGASLDIFPAADFAFVDRLTGDPILAESLEDIATVSRDSKAWSMGWSGVNGDPAGALIEHASGKAAWSPYGLRVAPAVENLMPNPRGEGGALPAWPSHWAGAVSNGTIAVTGRGIADGWPYIDVTVNGVMPSAGSYIALVGTTVAASPGETFTAHVGVSLISGSAPSIQFALVKASGTPEGANVVIALTQLHRRWALTRTMTAGATYARPTIYLPAGAYTNAVFRIFTPVLTKTYYLTAPVLPPVGSPGASVKALDTISVPVNFGWYRHDEGTLVVEYTRPAAFPSSAGLVALPDPSQTFYGRAIRFSGNTAVRGEAATLAGPVTSGETTNIAEGRHITAMRWSGTAYKPATDGLLAPGFAHAATIETPTALTVGKGGLNNSAPGGAPIHRIRFFPRALNDAELQAITTPHWSA